MASASIAELAAQPVVLIDQMQTLTARLLVAEQNVTLQEQTGMRGGDRGICDKQMYPRSFRFWSDWFLAWITMDNEEIGMAFKRAGKQDDPLDMLGLTPIQTVYAKAIYGHLRALIEVLRKAAKSVRLVKDDNGLEVWRKLVRKFDPQNAEVYAAQLEHIVTFGTRNVVKREGDVPTVLDQFRRVLDDHEEAAGEVGISRSGGYPRQSDGRKADLHRRVPSLP